MDNLSETQKFDFFSHGIASGVTDIYTAFMGPPAREAKASPYAKKATAKWNMPEAYVGENEYLRDTMEDFMLTAQWDFYTERIVSRLLLCVHVFCANAQKDALVQDGQHPHAVDRVGQQPALHGHHTPSDHEQGRDSEAYY